MHIRSRSRIIFLIISILFVGIVLSACSDSGGGSSPTPPTPAEEPNVAELEEAVEDSSAEIDASADENQRFGSAASCGDFRGTRTVNSSFYGSIRYGSTRASQMGITRSGTYTFSHRIDSSPSGGRTLLYVQAGSQARRVWSRSAGTMTVRLSVRPNDSIYYVLATPRGSRTNNYSLKAHGDPCGIPTPTRPMPLNPADNLARMLFKLPADVDLTDYNPGHTTYDYEEKPYGVYGLPMHAGHDFRSRRWTNGRFGPGLHSVYSPISGVVTATIPSYGGVGIYNLRRNVTVFLVHLDSWDVEVGDGVVIGTLIGKTGERGTLDSRGIYQPHLHVEIINGEQDKAFDGSYCGGTCTEAQIRQQTQDPIQLWWWAEGPSSN